VLAPVVTVVGVVDDVGVGKFALGSKVVGHVLEKAVYRLQVSELPHVLAIVLLNGVDLVVLAQLVDMQVLLLGERWLVFPYVTRLVGDV
jgi:hypothetical protein